MDEIRVLGFAGSLRRASYNRGLIRAAIESAPSGIVVDVFDLSEIPLYNQDVEDAGEPRSVDHGFGRIPEGEVVVHVEHLQGRGPDQRATAAEDAGARNTGSGGRSASVATTASEKKWKARCLILPGFLVPTSDGLASASA